MFRLRDWFQNDGFSPERLQQFLDHFYNKRGSRAEFAVIILARWNDVYAVACLGDIIHGQSPAYGQYYAGGSGRDLFSTLMNFKAPDGPLRDASGLLQAGLNIASHMLGREIYSGDTFRANFGGGFELSCLSADGFRRLDKIIHMFVRVTTDEDNIKVNPYPHITKQWYEEDSLFVLSLATMDAEPGGTRGMVLPSMFSNTIPQPALIDGPLKPDFLCVHHWLPGEEGNSHILTYSGDSLDAIEFYKVGDNLAFHLGPRYMREMTFMLEQRMKERGTPR
jgi:hypothetical protein